MHTTKTARNLKLALVGLDPPISISDFDNFSGTLLTPITEPGFREGAILNNEGKTLWAGVLKINDDKTFDLCVSPSATAASDETISWKDLPPFFTVFDGGYESLSPENVNILLDDLISFHDLVKIRCHFELNGKQESVVGKWGDQENLKTLSEILVDWNFTEKLQSQQLVLLEIELFETVYFVIAINEENDDVGIVLSLTSHFYQQRNRVGRRIPIEPIEIDGLKILEVSDFGMKVSSQATSVMEAAELEITIHGYKLLFGVTYKKKISSEETHMGLSIQDHSPDARKAWQGFLLGHQYPLLSYRTVTTHNDCWEVLEKSGYFKDVVGTMVKDAKNDVMEEWRFTDIHGPNLGMSVLGIEKTINKPVCTIGVSRAGDNIWVAQAAAVIDDPQFLNFTQSMYSWRTRAILQQIDGQYHLAFFDADKPFLDRFFRKFYLFNHELAGNKITWEEWFAFYIKPTFQIPDPSIMPNNASLQNSSKLFSLLKNSNNELGVKVEETPFGFKSLGRKHLHMAQILSSIWNETDSCEYLRSVFEYFEQGHKFVLTLNKKDFDSSLNEKQGAHKYVKLITWTCERSYLSAFLRNSLQSLEVMNKKYGKKLVA